MIALEVSTTGLISTTVIAFLVLLLILVAVILFAKAKLVPSGPVKIKINGENEIEVGSGSTLLSTLSGAKIFLTISLWWWRNLYPM